MHFEELSAITEEIMTNRPHFRLKVDLSKFFQDARRSCWIFIDATKIQQIIHLMHHISKLFTIEEPFHLLLNNTEYLPPIEDVRILEKNETILVVPGSGIHNGSNDTIEMQNSVSISKQLECLTDILNNVKPISQSNATKDMTFYSVINDTVNHSGESDTSKITDTNITEEMGDSFVSVGKRKRVRKRRPRSKNQFQLISSIGLMPENQSKEQTLKKPKIIDSYIIPSGKHIRFDKTEDENNVAKEIVQEVSKTESYLNKPMICSSKDFSTLLALGQSSTPITFASKKLKNEIKPNSLNDEVRMNFKKIIEDSVEKNVCNKEAKETESYKKLPADIDKIPIMITRPQVNDIIAFKTLKLGPDYSPQMSNVILSKVIDIEAKTGNYTLQIILGREEVQVPFGKFVVSDDESESQRNEDTFILNYSQIREPRLIS